MAEALVEEGGGLTAKRPLLFNADDINIKLLNATILYLLAAA